MTDRIIKVQASVVGYGSEKSVCSMYGTANVSRGLLRIERSDESTARKDGHSSISLGVSGHEMTFSDQNLREAITLWRQRESVGAIKIDDAVKRNAPNTRINVIKFDERGPVYELVDIESGHIACLILQWLAKKHEDTESALRLGDALRDRREKSLYRLRRIAGKL